MISYASTIQRLRVFLFRHGLFAIFFIVGIAIPIAYINEIAVDFISRDQWRFLEIVDNYFNGTFKLSDLWISHSEHRIPFYKTIFLLNAIFFDLNLNIELWVGILALAAIVLFLYWKYVNTTEFEKNPWLIQIGFIPIIFTATSLIQWSNFTFSLQSIGYLIILFYFFFWSYLDKKSNISVSMVDNIIVVVSAFLLLAILSGGIGPVFLLTTFIVLITKWFLDHDRRSSVARLIAAVLLAGVIAQMIYYMIGNLPPSRANLSTGISQLFSEPLTAIEYILLAFASSIVDTNKVIQDIGRNGIYVLGLLVGCLYAFSLYIYFKKETWRKTVFPLFLLLFSLILIGSIMVARIGVFGISNASSPRYIFLYNIGMIGIIWILTTAAIDSKWISKRIKPSYLMLLLAIPFVGAHAYSNYQQMEFSVYQAKNKIHSVRIIVELANTGTSKSKSFCPMALATCSNYAKMLKTHELNIFSPTYAGGNGFNCNFEITNWGPKKTAAGKLFNVRNNQSILVINYEGTVTLPTILFDGNPLPTRQRKNNSVRAFLQDPQMIAKPGQYPIVMECGETKRRKLVGYFSVF